MALLFVDSLAKNKSRFVQISCKILELLLLSMGLISTVIALKDALNLPLSCKIIFSSVIEFWSSVKCFLSSSPTTITVVAINLMILLIFALHHHSETTSSYLLGHVDVDKFDIDLEFQIDHDHSHDRDQLILEPPPLPPPSAPPIWDVVEVAPLPPPPSDVAQTTWYDDVSNQDSTGAVGLQTHPTSDVQTWYDDVSNQDSNVAVGLQTHPTSDVRTWYDDVSNQDSTTVGLQTHPTSDVQSVSNQDCTIVGLQTHLTSDVHTAAATIEKWKDVLIEKAAVEEEEREDLEGEDNTMDDTWQAIIGGGKPKPKAKAKEKKKGLKKSETWEETAEQRRRRRRPRRLDSEEVVPTSPKWRELRKAETFNDAVSATRRGGLVRRDPSMSLEEFNEKVDRFIKKINDGIRLQRQESYRRFLGIINQRG